MKKMANRKTTMVRVYKATNDLFNTRFPEVKKADLIKILADTHPMFKIESYIRGKKLKIKNDTENNI